MSSRRTDSWLKEQERRTAAQSAETAVKTVHTCPLPSTVPEQTTECCMCHRSDQPVLRCPCHTICEPCMKGRGMLDANNLRCPLCPDQYMSKVEVVIGKVKNLWLTATNDKHTKSDVRSCGVHVKQTLEFLCQRCDVAICPFCKLAEHEGHVTKSLGLAAADAKQRVADASSTRLCSFEERLHTAVKENKKKRETFHQSQKEVAQVIQHRHVQLTGIIDKYRDNALQELEAMAVEVESCAEQDESRMNTELKALSDLQTRIDHSVSDTDPCDILTIDREIQADWSHDQIMVRRSLAFPSYSYKMEHDSEYTTASDFNEESVTLQTDPAAAPSEFKRFVDQFIGHPALNKTSLPKLLLDVEVTPKFRSCEDPGALVLSVCPVGAGSLAVSYSTSPDHEDGVTEGFYEDGRPSMSFDFGLCTLCADGNDAFRPAKYNRLILSKSGNKHALLRYPDGSCVLGSFPVNKIDDSDAVAPLNFDATGSGDVVAIVDLNDQVRSVGNNLMNTNRVVKLISFSGGSAFTDVYDPPSPDFVPSDVCFICSDGGTVLLVSDMGTSSIHILSIQPFKFEGKVFQKCQFLQYLVADHDMLKQPTALNMDEKGRLWVACKGGQLLTVELVR